MNSTEASQAVAQFLNECIEAEAEGSVAFCSVADNESLYAQYFVSNDKYIQAQVVGLRYSGKSEPCHAQNLNALLKQGWQLDSVENVELYEGPLESLAEVSELSARVIDTLISVYGLSHDTTFKVELDKM
jgi:hypothetical protein